MTARPRTLALIPTVAAALIGCSGSSSGGASVSMTPTAIAFSAVRYATAPASKTIHVTASASNLAGVVVGLPPGVAMPSWLSVATVGTNPASFDLRLGIQDTSVPPGHYQVTLRAVAVDASGNVLAFTDATVTYDVTVGLVATPDALGFTRSIGDSAPPPAQTLQVKGDGLSFSATPSVPWLQVTPASGTAPTSISVSVDPTGLGMGSHAGTITLTSGSSQAVVPVTLTVGLPALTVSPATLAVGGPDGLDLGTVPFTLTLDTGTNVWPWTATFDPGSGPNWLLLDQSSGNVSGAGVALTADAARAGLTSGTFAGTITFTATVEGQAVSRQVPATLRLGEHALRVSSPGVALTSGSRLATTVRVTDSHGLSGTPWTASSGLPLPWLAITSSGTTPGDLQLTADPTGLALDTLYRATVQVTSSDPSVERAATIEVGFWVNSTAPAPVSVSGPPGSFVEVATDPVRPYAYVHDGGTAISVYNVHTGAQAGTIAAVAAQLGPMAVSADGRTLYAVDRAAGAAAIVPVDLEGGVVAAAWPLQGTAPASIAFASPGGKAMMISSGGTVHDALTGAVLASQPPLGTYLGASPTGGRVCGIDAGFSPATITCRNFGYTTLGGGGLVSSAPVSGSGGVSNGRDVAVSADGSRVYAVGGAPYGVTVLDGTTLASAAPPYATSYYPVAVTVGPEGRIYTSSQFSPPPVDTWALTADGLQLGTWSLGGSASVRQRQLAVSGDGTRLVALTDAPALKIVSTP